MRVFLLLFQEIRHRSFSATLAVVAVALAVAAVDFQVGLLRLGQDETRLIQRDMGLNVIILPAATDLDRFWSLGYSDQSLPQDYMERVRGQEVANRLIPLVRRRVTWREVDVMLTGIAEEVFKGKEMDPVFGMSIPAGSLTLGGTVARVLDLNEGEEVQFLGEDFRVGRVLSEVGTEEDVRVYGNLLDVQRLLGLEGRLTEIQALECNCADDESDPLARLQNELEPLLPGTQVLRKSQAAEARRHQRRLASRSFTVSSPVLVVLCGLWIGMLAMLNVRGRRREIGVLRALGYDSSAIAWVVLLRSMLLGLIGALVGGFLGPLLVATVGKNLFLYATPSPWPEMWLFVPGLIAAPLFAALSSLVPAVMAATQDPSEALRDD